MLRFETIAERLILEIGSVGDGFSFEVKRAGEIADTEENNFRVELSLKTVRADTFGLSFVNLGHGFIRVDPYLLVRGRRLTALERSTFQINYAEDLATAQIRFSPWLERVIVAGLSEWRRSL